MKTLFLSLGALCLIATHASAQVSYVREIVLPEGISPILSTVRAPVNPSDPSYDPNFAELLLINSGRNFYYVDPATGSVQGPAPFPDNPKIDETSHGAQTNLGNPQQPMLYLTSPRSPLYGINMDSQNLETQPRLQADGAGFIFINSIAGSRQGDVTIMSATDHNSFVGGYAINVVTGAAQLVFGGVASGSGAGQFSNAYYHAYGPNDLAYVLDYGNDRVQMLDPENNFDYVGQFALEDGVTTANMQFAIGANGNVYLGDGLGGGSSYAADGTYLGAFALPGSVDGQDLPGTPYLTDDKYGNVYVFDDTGFHQYLDASVVPEPSTWALIGLGVGVLAWRRRRSIVSR